MRNFLDFLAGNIKAGVFIVLAAALIVLDDIGRVQQMNALPHYVWQVGAALIFMGAVVSILFHQHRRLEAFKPEPAAPPDAAAAALSNSIAQLTYLRDVRQDFEKRAADAEETWKALLKGVEVVTPETPAIPTQSWKVAYTKWTNEIKVIQRTAFETLEFQRDFLESTNFIRNPGIQVPHEDNLGIDADKYELRRAYDEHKFAVAAINGFRKILVTKEKQRQQEVWLVAKAVVNGPKP